MFQLFRSSAATRPTIPSLRRRALSAVICVLVASPMLAAAVPPVVQAAPVGEGFTVSAADLDFILDQIVMAEQHTAAIACWNTEAANPLDPCTPAKLAAIHPSLVGVPFDRTGDPNFCAGLRAIIGSPLLSFGLRLVDGSCNNLQPTQGDYGAADQPFPRLTTPVFSAAEDQDGSSGPPGPTSYAQTSGVVVDSEPRTISNLIVDQTATNPAAVAAAGFPVRTQGNDGAFPCDVNNLPVGCIPAFKTLPIDNVTTDVGLSPPFNSLFTIFGQFFDHGLDKITNGGNGAVMVPLKADDPLIPGPDHILGTSDDLPPGLRFMVLTRGHIVPGDDGFRNAPNTDTPFVDQSQTYTSHSSHQVFTREYVNNINGKPVPTAKFLSTPDGGLPTWAQVKAQAANLLGLQLSDADVGNIPMIAADGYGNFLPGPNGLPQYVTATGLVEGNIASPVPVPANVLHIDTAFLNDIAHSAAPTFSSPGVLFPDADLVAGNSLVPASPAGSYDDELLDLHFICGDGRCNENIALTAVHEVFHLEHDRLVDDVKATILDPVKNGGILNLADWQDPDGAGGWNGERLFQAARFVTEMEYQHLVFEEFARKVQPLINPFQAFAFGQTDLNPAITAEFAHAVYRFGHSMLDDTIPRLNADGSHNDIPLLDGFLNPAAFDDANASGSVSLSTKDATGAIIMGLSDQTGQEIDEFVVETLRNNLLGLPLDLPAINMTRARSEGIPPLNEVRRQIFGATNDGQLRPYTDWVDFGLNLKHPESLVNFVAAYGRHPNVTGLDPDGSGPMTAGTLASRRAAADQIVNGTVLPSPEGPINPPADAADFMFHLGTWAAAETGVNDIDLWVGGLAERTNLFGGLLGTTFNYVFENQLTNLQNGDRLYYLGRTPGMNLRAQLEGNSFAELVMRNTNAHTLKADPFATADCKFELENLQGQGTAGTTPEGLANLTGVGSVNDDPNSDCNENQLLVRMGDGTIRYRASNKIDVPGINGQAVYNGRAGDVVDRIYGGVDNDTFWGGPGNDIIEGGDGADIALGGEGDDIITDIAGDDIPKGGPGNDAIDAGPGLDIIMGGDGNDFTNGGANINETFGGAGDDFAIAGQGEDAVFGDSGDDWMEGGDQPDLLIGDSSTLFFDDHNFPGHDVTIGQGGDDDYDGEGGDDIFVTGPGIEKNAGASGYDWSIGMGDPQPQNADLNLRIIVGQPPIIETRDKFNEVEALSGWQFDDVLRGDDVVPSGVGGGGFIGCDALDAAGVARIANLDTLVPAAIRTSDSAAIAAASATRFCLLQGPAWGDGNVIVGGTGSDTMEGRGADDILDGDRWVRVYISVRDPLNHDLELGTTELMENTALTGDFGPGTAGMTLQAAVFAGKVNGGQLVAMRELVTPTAGQTATDVDTALFSGDQSEYTIVFNANGSVTVSHVGGAATDGIDTLWNMEQFSFCILPGLAGVCDQREIVPIIPPPPAPAIGLTIGAGITTFTAAAGEVTAPDSVVVTNVGTADLVIGTVTTAGGDPLDFLLTDACGGQTLAPGASCTILVRFAPTSGGLKVALLDIASNADAGDTLVALIGTAVAPIATVTAPPDVTAFTAIVGGTSAAEIVTVTNDGDADLVISGAALAGANPGEFLITGNGCTVAVIPGASCDITVAFRPTSGGPKTADLVISHNAGADSVVALAGTGLAPIASITAPAALTTFTAAIGATSPAVNVTVTNTGTAPLNFGPVTLGGANANQFVVTANGCVASLNPGGSCAIGVAFRPLTTGAKTANLVINHNAGAPSVVALAGTTVAGPPAPAPVMVLPVSTNFGTRRVGTTRTQTVRVTNNGPGALLIGTPTATGPFTVTRGNCPASLAVGLSCRLSVSFRPTVVGLAVGTLTVPSNAVGNPRTSVLTGTGR